MRYVPVLGSARRSRILAVVLAVGFGSGVSLADSTSVAVVKGEDVTAKVALPDIKALAGHQIPVTVDFSVAPGWHLYGPPLPPEYTVTKVTFDNDLIQKQA